MRGYAAMLTGLVGAIVGFDVSWLYTSREVMGCAFIGMMVGFLVAAIFLLISDKVSEVHEKIDRKEHRPEYTKDEETGISYMPMRKGRSL